MASCHLYLTREDCDRFKNKKLVDVVLPNVLGTVIEWGCPKAKDDSYRTHLKKKIEESGWDQYLKKKWKRYERPKLDESNCSTFDVTFLYKLIPEVCSQVAPANTPVWTDFQNTTLESLVTRCKDIRNNVCHEPVLAAIDSDIAGKVRDLSTVTLRTAGRLYMLTASQTNISQQVVDKKVTEVEKTLDDICQADLSPKEKELALYEKYFRLRGIQDILSHKKTSSVFLPICGIKLSLNDVYHNFHLLCEDEDKNVSEHRCSELFQEFASRFVFITGHAGSGKSSLLRRIVDDCLFRVEPELFPGIRNFPLVLHVECKDTTVPNCATLIKRKFPEIVKKVTDIEDALIVLQRMGILIAADGLDEMNKSSDDLFNELIELFGVHGNATFVVTSRPVAVPNWKQVLQEKNVDCICTSIKLLANESEQMEFLNRYQEKISSIAHPELTDAFGSLNLDSSFQTHFSFPIYLVMFCYLFITNKANAHEWTSENQIMTHFIEACKDSMIRRLRKLQCVGKNPRTRVADLIYALGGLSLRLLEQDSFEINERTYAAICKKCFDGINVDYESILSCLFLNDSGKDGFHFVHESQCEILASKHLVARVSSWKSSGQDADLVKTLSLILSDDISSIKPNMEDSTASLRAEGEDVPNAVNMERFLNVLRFALMNLVEEGPQQTAELFLNELCRALSPLRLGFDFWTEITVSCPNSEMVAKAAAREALADLKAENQAKDPKWSISTARHMAAVARMLPHCQLSKLCVARSASAVAPSVRRQLMDSVKSYTGLLELDWRDSYYQFESYDNEMICLELTSCKLTKFAACVTNSAVQLALIKAVSSEGYLSSLRIALSDPWTHMLAALEGTEHRLRFRTKLLGGASDQRRRPLPVSGSQGGPELTVVLQDDQGDPEKVAELIDVLAPKDKRYHRLYLENWPGTVAALDQLVKDLIAAGVRTSVYGTNSPRLRPQQVVRFMRDDGLLASSTRWTGPPTVRVRWLTCCRSSHPCGKGPCVELILP